MSSGEPRNGGSTPPDPSDRELLESLRAGDDEAYARLWHRHHPAALRAARQYDRSQGAADIAAEAFARVLDTVRQGDGTIEAFRAYLLRAVSQVALNAARSRRLAFFDDERGSDPAFVDGASDADDVGGDPALDALDEHYIARAYDQLTPEQREILWYVDVERVPIGDASTMLGVPADTATALAAQAREDLSEEYLRVHLDRRGDNPGCAATLERMAGYTRGSVTALQRMRIDRHVGGCGSCSLALAELNEIGIGLREVLGPLVLGTAAASFGYFAELAEDEAAYGASAGAAALEGAPEGATEATVDPEASGAAGTAGAAGAAGVAAAGAYDDDLADPRDEASDLRRFATPRTAAVAGVAVLAMSGLAIAGVLMGGPGDGETPQVQAGATREPPVSAEETPAAEVTTPPTERSSEPAPSDRPDPRHQQPVSLDQGRTSRTPEPTQSQDPGRPPSAPETFEPPRGHQDPRLEPLSLTSRVLSGRPWREEEGLSYIAVRAARVEPGATVRLEISAPTFTQISEPSGTRSSRPPLPDDDTWTCHPSGTLTSSGYACLGQAGPDGAVEALMSAQQSLSVLGGQSPYDVEILARSGYHVEADKVRIR